MAGSVAGNVFFVGVETFTPPACMVTLLQLEFGTMFIIFAVFLSTEAGAWHCTRGFLMLSILLFRLILYLNLKFTFSLQLLRI